jgi:hypothetical protein
MTPDEYVATVEDRRRTDVAALDALIRETAPDLERVTSGPAIGYGPFHYRYASGREGDAALIGLAANKRYLSLYVPGAAAEGLDREGLRAVHEPGERGRRRAARADRGGREPRAGSGGRRGLTPEPLERRNGSGHG